MSVTVVFCDPANVETQHILVWSGHFHTLSEHTLEPRQILLALDRSRQAMLEPPQIRVLHYDLQFGAQAIPFMAMRMHTEAGGMCVALRGPMMYAAFGFSGAPEFEWVWEGTEYFLLHSVEVIPWDEQQLIRRYLERDNAVSRMRPIKA